MSLHQHPVELLQTLIRFDTSNPPGNERAIIRYLNGLIRSYGIETQLLSMDPNRPNLVARIYGRGEAPPLVLQGHVDCVPVTGQEWTYGPFSAEIHNDYVWGRGALDMKSGVAMLVCAFLELHSSGRPPAGDIILCLLADEEFSGTYGAKYLVEQHRELFADAKYSIGEFGGFPMQIGDAKCYAIQIAERVSCTLKLTMRGPAGHGAMPMRDGAAAELGRILTQLNERSLPIHICEPTRIMIESIGAATSGPTSFIMRQLLNPRRTETMLKLLGPRLATLEPLFRHTVNATMIHGGDAPNVIPGTIELTLDGRMLPGFTSAEMIAELREIVGHTVEIEQVGDSVPAPKTLDMGLFPLLADILRDLDPDAKPIPYMLPAVSDGRFFGSIGIQNYGFLPLNLPPDFNFTAYVHAADERVPVESVYFGTRALIQLLHRYR